MNREDARCLAVAIALEGAPLTSGVFARRAGVTRQAAHRHLRILEGIGLLARRGAGRGSHFELTRVPLAQWTFSREDVDESVVWEQTAILPRVQQLRSNVRSLLRHALTELVNNAIEHSRGERVTVSLHEREGSVSLVVTDDGVGIFRHIVESRGLADESDAVAMLQTGKVTTDPERHAGEGLFFVSRMGDLVAIESGHTRWVVDNTRHDASVGEIVARRGTTVTWTIATASRRTTGEVFGAFTDDELSFSRTEVRVRLLQKADEFVSRAEARRLAAQLGLFGSVTLDFEGVQGIGQGFADELFRVWQRDHPRTELHPINMNPAVRLLVDRVRRGAAPHERFPEDGPPSTSRTTEIIRVGAETRTGPLGP